jgi:hypothetical protein
MRALIQVRGVVDDLALWPYASGAEPYNGDSLLSVDVVDGREMVGVLVALLDRGLDVVKVVTLGPRAADPPGESPDVGEAAARDAAEGG